jgi:hypothetical protein
MLDLIGSPENAVSTALSQRDTINTTIKGLVESKEVCRVDRELLSCLVTIVELSKGRIEALQKESVEV